MLMCVSALVIFNLLAQLLDVGALLADHTPGRAEWIVTRHFLCGRSMTILETRPA
jgi:hypothetical protein